MRGMLLAALLLSAGCVTGPQTRPEEKGPDLPYRTERAVPVVQPDGISGKNAWERAKELRAELDREGRAAE